MIDWLATLFYIACGMSTVQTRNILLKYISRHINLTPQLRSQSWHSFPFLFIISSSCNACLHTTSYSHSQGQQFLIIAGVSRLNSCDSLQKSDGGVGSLGKCK